MKTMSSVRTFLSALTLGAAALCSGPAVAAPVLVNEVGDAGDSLATAQDARFGLATLSISGSLSNEPATLDWVDMYRIDVPRGVLIASTGPGGDPQLIADPVLYLFDAAGIGIAMDDESGGFGQSLLSLVGSLAVGEYHVAIAFAGVEPVDANGNSIFDAFGAGGVLSTDALAGWGGLPFAIDPGVEGRYGIAVEVPVPGTLVLSAMGLFALIRIRRGLQVQAQSRAAI
jgi:hypothetical protein